MTSFVYLLLLILFVFPGRKYTILGDTSNARSGLSLFKNSTVLIHECTNGRMPDNGKSEDTVDYELGLRGHSSPVAAGKFAKAAEAEHLILNHISQSITKSSELVHLRKRASEVSGIPMEKVTIAHDFMLFRDLDPTIGGKQFGQGPGSNSHISQTDKQKRAYEERQQKERRKKANKKPERTDLPYRKKGPSTKASKTIPSYRVP